MGRMLKRELSRIHGLFLMKSGEFGAQSGLDSGSLHSMRELARTRAFFEILGGRFWSDSGLEQKATKVTKEKILHFGTGQI